MEKMDAEVPFYPWNGNIPVRRSPTRREGNEARLHKLRYSTIYGGKKKEPTWLGSKI
jgi:hypothetical protein